MRIHLALWALVAATAIAPLAHASDPSPVTWLLGLFAHHAKGAPACKIVAACTADEQAVRDEYAAVRLEIARAAVAVAYDTAEAPLFRGKYGRARTALRLATVDAHESGLQPIIVHGCNPDRDGPACGPGQVHPGTYGLRLTTDKIVLCDKPGPGCLDATDLLADPVLMQRVMLRILRLGGLGLYTGEGATEGEASLTIREWESGWWRSHPAPTPDAEVISALAEGDD